MHRAFTYLGLTVALTACDTPPVAVSPKGEPINTTGAVVMPGDFMVPDDAVVHAFARSFLNAIQPASIADRVEYCGYFYVEADGSVAATPPLKGTFATCNMPAPRQDDTIFASYHTHGAFGRNYDNEVPSVTDLRSDFDFRVDGYVSTPGGRVWHVDYGTRTTRQICGLSCVYTDPNFQPVDEASVRQSYTIQTLAQRANGF